MHVKWSVTLTDRLGPEVLTMLEMKGLVLDRVRLLATVPFFYLFKFIIFTIQTLTLLMLLTILYHTYNTDTYTTYTTYVTYNTIL